MSYQNEWLLFEAEDEFDEIKHREPTEELLFYRAVASGDIKTVKKNCERQRFTECDGVGVLSKNAVTNMKYHFVITTAMITRLCKQNGMEMEQAFRLSDFYIQKLDGIHTVEEVQSLHDEMVMDYTEKMRRYFRDNTYSKHINASKEYIYSHIKERITIEDLADSLGVSASYLSRLFKKETGISVSAYIRRQKIEMAKNLLQYSDYPIIEIAPIHGFYDYKNKYQAGSTIETCPAELSEEKTLAMQAAAEQAFKVLRLKNYARMDFMMDEKGDFYCLEANTLPGMTPTSLLPQEAKVLGIEYADLCQLLIDISMRDE